MPASPHSVLDITGSPVLLDLLSQRPEPVAALTRRVLALVAAWPGLEPRIMPGWGSVNFRHARAGHVCALFPEAEGVALYFEHGRLLSDPGGILNGHAMKRGRVLRLRVGDEVPVDVVGILLAEAIALFG